jgi:EF-P beta-lysylation protein EpmB
MIPRTTALQHTPAWQKALAQAIQDPRELLQLLQLESRLPVATDPAALHFPLRVPRGFAARMRVGDPLDPLLRQVLPLDAEGRPAAGFSADPLAEQAAMPVPGLLHKYRGRVLLTLTGACGVHCRYCFRRHFPYGDANPAPDQWEAALDYLRSQPDIHEVLLSGGDPLSLNDRRLAGLVRQLEAIPHLKRLRIHSRLPVVLPERVDDGLLAWLADSRLTRVLVIHANHAREIDASVAAALSALRGTGTQLLNQAVLLRGVNDSPEALADLSEALIAAGVQPYYLHLLDRVSGTAHFEVPEREALDLLRALQTRLPGYLVPRLAREEPGASSKTWLQP